MRAVIALVCALAALAFAKDVVCNTTISDTKNRHSYKFDLSQLHHPESTYVDSLWYRTSENNIYYVNFCGQTASACEDTDCSVCLRLVDGEDYKYVSVGKTSSQKFSIAEDGSPQNSVIVTYSDGAKCPSGSGTYSTKISVTCQPNSDPGFFYDIDESDPCNVELFMYSSAGCGEDVPYVEPEDSGMGGGEVFATVILIILAVAVVLYFGLGAIYMWKVKEASAPTEFVIHNEFWCALPFLIKDGVMFIVHGCKKGDYVSV